MKCLFIEDEIIKPVDIDPILRRLKTEGFEIDTAEDGTEAMKKLHSERYDVILLDINLERGINQSLQAVRRAEVGLNVLQRIRRGEFEEAGNPKDIPVVVLSAVILVDVMAQIRELILEEYYLIKPKDPATVADAVKRAVQKQV